MQKTLQGLMIDLIRLLSESGQKTIPSAPLCVLKRPEGAGEREKPSFPQSNAWTISIAEGLIG